MTSFSDSFKNNCNYLYTTALSRPDIAISIVLRVGLDIYFGTFNLQLYGALLTYLALKIIINNLGKDQAELKSTLIVLSEALKGCILIASLLNYTSVASWAAENGFYFQAFQKAASLGFMGNFGFTVIDAMFDGSQNFFLKSFGAFVGQSVKFALTPPVFNLMQNCIAGALNYDISFFISSPDKFWEFLNDPRKHLPEVCLKSLFGAFDNCYYPNLPIYGTAAERINPLMCAAAMKRMAEFELAGTIKYGFEICIDLLLPKPKKSAAI